MTTTCERLQVIELGAGSMAASLAGMIFADNGARVVKIEPPEGGFVVWNRGKESAVADLRTGGGCQQLRELAVDADVVIEGFAPGTTDAWGIGPEALRALNPALVYCSITGFGRTGAYARLKGYEALVAAKIGMFARGAFAPRRGPMMFPQPSAGFGAAMQAVAGVVAALLVRERTGRGEHVEVTMVQGADPTDYFTTLIWQLATRDGKPPPLDAAASLTANRYGILVATKDGRFIQTSTLLPHQAKALIEAAGVAAVLDQPEYANVPMFATPEDAQAWEDLMWETFRTKDLAEWLPILESYPDVAFEIARTSEEGLEHPQIVHNGDVIVVDDPVVGAVREVGPIGHFRATPSVIKRSAPALGANAGPFDHPAAPVAAGDAPAHPLAGITLIEFGSFYAMPFALTMAASLGARVIKIEDGQGDPMRRSFGPELGSTRTTFGKESVSVDLRTREGQAIAHQLVARADLFANGFRRGVAERLRLGYEELAQLNPRLVYLHATGYGVDGPYAQRALYAQAAQAVAGSFGRQVGYWLVPERNIGMSVTELQVVVAPRLAHIVDGDSNAALAVFAAMTLGLYHQQTTGQGQFVATSMIAGNAYAYSDDFCSYRGKRPVALCDSENYGLNALYRLYETADGWICLVITTEREWHAFVRAVGDHELADGRFATPADRAANDDALTMVLTQLFKRQPASRWEDQLSAARVGCVEAFLGGQSAFTSTDPVMRDTGLSIEYDHPQFGRLVRAAPPVRFSEVPSRVGPPCLRGEHNVTILSELGYSPDEIDSLTEQGIVFPADDSAR